MNTPQHPGFGPSDTPHGGYPAPPAHPPYKPSRRKAWLTHGGVAVAALIVGTGIGSSGQAETETVTAKPKKTKTSGPDSDFGCYWARLKDASGEFDAIIANNNLEGPGRVTLNKGEYFQTQRCQEWRKVS
ncbi:hypothetical protein J7E96_31755 [Streptomyces sp. ISL-96]|uniref:hypothetical protein n=1 Tax=Streptomyces sp. ISL-96 TaxID=2819191 RepID=UPI001BE533EB|nr:hypothetical protein [Streptomyces sp. ISL-96]MBT2493001.1 hypothetical protein [Streptomyces sp. ISL-96]